jgi:hypothetical protein
LTSSPGSAIAKLQSGTSNAPTISPELNLFSNFTTSAKFDFDCFTGDIIRGFMQSRELAAEKKAKMGEEQAASRGSSRHKAW